MIRFTQMAAVNDPFDCHPRLLEPEELSWAPQAEHRCCLESYVYQVFSKRYSLRGRQSVGMLSLTEKPDNLLMWAHYAQNHEGFIIGFDTDHEFFSKSDDGTGLWKVKYSMKRPSLPKNLIEEQFSRQPKINPHGFVNVFIDRGNNFNPDSDPDDYRFVKSFEWEHEQEWRLVRNLNPPYYILTISPFPIYLFPFPRTAVHSLIIGCRRFPIFTQKFGRFLIKSQDTRM